MRQNKRRSIGRKSIMAGILATAMLCPSLAGCDGNVRKHPDRWTDEEIAENEAKRTQNQGSDTTPGKAKSKVTPAPQETGTLSPVSQLPKGGDTSESASDFGTANQSAQNDGIWIRTEVRTTLTDEDGETISASYESTIDDRGNVISTDIESDDWDGSISYSYDADGYRKTCVMTGSGQSKTGSVTWIPEFEVGFLGMVGDENTTFENSVGTNKLLTHSSPDDNGESVATYGYDENGNLTRMSLANGHAEDYDANGNLLRVQNADPTDPSNTELVEYAYSRDGAGRVKGATLTYVETDGDETAKETIGKASYDIDSNGNATRTLVTDIEDEFGYRLTVDCEYEYVPTPSKGAKLYSRLDRYGLFF